MPLRFGEDLAAGPVARLPQAPEAPRPGALDTLAAASRQGNIAGALYDALNTGGRPGGFDPDYDPFGDLAGYEDFADRFLDAGTAAETAYIKQRIDAEQADRQTLQQAGGWGLAATLAAGVVDPTTLLSMAIPVVGATRAARLGSIVGAQIVGDTATEVAFQGAQETRTLTESAINVGAGTVLAGVLGSVASRIPAAELQAVRQRLGREMQLNPDPGSQSFGAAAAARTTMADETVAAGGETLDRTLGRVAPGARLLNSPSLEARRVVQELAETPEILDKNLRGVATPAAIETSLKRAQGQWWQAYQARRDAYRTYRERARAAGEPLLSRKQFGEEVAFAMRRGDDSMIPEAAQAARDTRRLVFEPYKARAQKAGLLAEDVVAKGADSYLLRQYNVAKIRRNMTGWIETLTEGFQRQGLEAAEAADVAHKVTRNILGSEQGTLDLDVMADIVPQSGRLKERTLNLPDEVLEPYLVNDIDNLTQAYLRTLGPEVEMVERFGDRDLKDVLDKVRQEYAVYKQKAAAGGDDAKLKELQKREEADLRDLQAIRDRLYGRFGAPKDPGNFFVRAGRLVRAVNYTRLLGGQVISAMTDAAKLMMQYGAPRMMGSALKLATNLEGLKLARTEARRIGIGLDLVLNTRGISLGDIGEYSTFAEQEVMRRVSDVFSVASLQSPWNAVMKSWASVMSQDEVLRAATKAASGGALSKRTLTRMAQLGLDEDMLRRVAAQAEEHGVDDGLRFGNSDKWKDQEAARIFESAIIKDVDTAVLTPGAGDLPLVYSTEWGKALLQFKSFSLASVRRLQIPVAQGVARGDLATMTGLMASFGLGATVYALKQITAGQPIDTNSRRFALEVVDKTGLTAWAGDIIYPALWQLGSDDFSRWSDRQPVETILGPVAGTVADVYSMRLPDKVVGGDLSASDIHKLRRLLPGQNLWYLRQAINRLEEGAADAAGAN